MQYWRWSFTVCAVFCSSLFYWHLIIKVVQICDLTHGSILSLHSSLILILMRIRIKLFTLIRIWIRLPKIMRIRIWICSAVCTIFTYMGTVNVIPIMYICAVCVISACHFMFKNHQIYKVMWPRNQNVLLQTNPKNTSKVYCNIQGGSDISGPLSKLHRHSKNLIFYKLFHTKLFQFFLEAET